MEKSQYMKWIIIEIYSELHDINPQYQTVQQMSGGIIHTETEKLQNIKDKNNILKTAREK